MPPVPATPVVALVRASLDRRAVAATIGVLLLYAVSVLTPFGQLLGDLILTGRPTEDPDRIAAARDVLGVVSVTTLALAGLAIAAIAVLRRRPWLAIAVLVAIVGANLTTQVLKRLVLPRPNLTPDLPQVYLNSYPSGHATVVAVLALALLVVVPARLRPPVALVGVIGFALTGTSTIIAGWHRMEDVVGAGLVALAWVAATAAIVVRRRGAVPVADHHRTGHRVAGRALVVGALVVGVLGLLAWGQVFVEGDEIIAALDAGTASAQRLFAGAAVITVAAAIATVATLWRAIRRGEIERPGRRLRARGAR